MEEITEDDVVLSEPSNIDEVVVKITGEAVEVNYLFINYFKCCFYPRLLICPPPQLNPQCLPLNSV